MGTHRRTLPFISSEGIDASRIAFQYRHNAEVQACARRPHFCRAEETEQRALCLALLRRSRGGRCLSAHIRHYGGVQSEGSGLLERKLAGGDRCRARGRWNGGRLDHELGKEQTFNGV